MLTYAAKDGLLQLWQGKYKSLIGRSSGIPRKKKRKKYKALICGLTKPHRAKLRYRRKKKKKKNRKIQGLIGRSSGILYYIYQYTNVLVYTKISVY